MSTNHAALVFYLSKAAKEMSRPSLRMRALIAESAGIHVTDAECIDYLLDMGQASATDLAQAMHLSKSSVTAMIDRLERVGYVTRTIDETDRRRIIVAPNLPLVRERILPFYHAYGTAFQEMAHQYTHEELCFLTKHYEAVTALYQQQVAILECEE
ncbi:MAG: MarR family transcriptional regulator [Thermomicrobiales bacterium]|nr:MarR family transcriptional regulator [Thermomicrobiales bacterium]